MAATVQAIPALSRIESLVREITINAEFFYAADGVRLNLLRAAPSQEVRDSKATVLLIPGWCMPATVWRETMLALAPHHEVLALDPRGQGESEVPASGYHIDQRADDLARCIDRFERVVLVAWSLGALESLHYLYRHGEEKIAGLVLVDSSIGEDPPPAAAVGFREAFRSDRGKAMQSFIRAMFASLRPEPEIASLCERALRMPLEASLALFPSHLPREHWRAIARGVRAPLLYAVTSQFVEQGQNLLAARPGTKIEIFENAGHALFIDEADRFQRMMQEFILETRRDG